MMFDSIITDTQPLHFPHNLRAAFYSLTCFLNESKLNKVKQKQTKNVEILRLRMNQAHIYYSEGRERLFHHLILACALGRANKKRKNQDNEMSQGNGPDNENPLCSCWHYVDESHEQSSVFTN